MESITELFAHLNVVFRRVQADYREWVIERQTSHTEPDLPSTETMECLKARIYTIELLSWCPITSEMIHDAFRFGLGSSREDATVTDFAVDLTTHLEPNEDALKLIRLTLEYDPECYRALCHLQSRLAEDDEELVLTLRKLVVVGRKIGRNVSIWLDHLHDRERPARDENHAMLIAYNLNHHRIKKKFKFSYLSCIHQKSAIRVYMGGTEKDLPPSEILNIDGYKVSIDYYLKTVL